MTKKIVTLSELQLTDLIKRAINEAHNETENYMTFSNLQQLKRQIDMLLELDEDVVDQIIQNGEITRSTAINISASSVVRSSYSCGS